MAGLDEVFREGFKFSKAEVLLVDLHRRSVRPSAARDERAGHGSDGQD